MEAKRYIATLYMGTGHAYIGPDANVEEIIACAKADIAENAYGEPVDRAYVGPFDEETFMPDSDADPIWLYLREK